MQVVDRSLATAVLAGDEVIDHARLQRPGSEQRNQRDDVLEAIGLQASHQILHAARLELEHRGRLAGFEQGEGRCVVHRQIRHVERRTNLARRDPCGVDGAHGVVDHGQRAKAEEVELDEARGLDVVLVELRHHRAATRFAVERREVFEHRRRNHNAAGVLAGVARQPLERSGEIEQRAHLLVGVAQLAQLRLLFERSIEGDVELEGNEFGDTVHPPIAVAEHAPRVAHHRLSRHGAVGDDLRDAVAPVFVRDIVDHAIAAVHAEVDVEVRHRDAFGIEETLE